MLEGRGEGGSALCEGYGGKPREVPEWRENPVKATDGSLQGLCKQGKKQMTEHTVHALFKTFKGVSMDSSPFEGHRFIYNV